MWFLEILSFGLGLIVPVLICFRLFRDYYTQLPREWEILTNLPKLIHSKAFDIDPRDLLAMENKYFNNEVPASGYISIQNKPIGPRLRILSIAGTLTCLLCVLYGLQFFAGIGSYFDNIVWHVLTYLVFIGLSLVLSWIIILGVTANPPGDRWEFPIALLNSHAIIVAIICVSFSVGGLFGYDLIGWTYALFVTMIPVISLIFIVFFLLGGSRTWMEYQTSEREKKIRNRVALLDTASKKRDDGCSSIQSRLVAEDINKEFAKSLIQAFQAPNVALHKNIHLQISEKKMPSLEEVNQATKFSLPSYSAILMNYWTPLGKPKRRGEFTPWNEYVLSTCISREPTKSPKVHKKMIQKMMKRTVNPIQSNFEPQFLSVENVDEVQKLIDLWNRFEAYPEVLKRVFAGEDEMYVLVDLGLFQD